MFMAPAGDVAVQPVEEEREGRHRGSRVEMRERPALQIPHGQEHRADAAGGIGKGEEIREVEPADHREVLHKRCLSESARNTAVTTRRTAALIASARWMPIRLPPRPTVTPLKARRPRADMAKRPMTRPRTSGGALICTRVCAMAKKASSRKPATNSSNRASG